MLQRNYIGMNMHKPANPLHQAVSFLSRREHSEYELRQKLHSKGHDSDSIEQAISILQARGYLNERRYAEAILRHQAARGQGPQKIRYYLTQQQLSPALINQVFADTDTDWFACAAQVREKKFGNTSLPDERSRRYKEQTKQMRFLLGRGFTQDQIEYALARLSQTDKAEY
jgi:regulatory protein